MKTMLKLVTLGAVLACAGVAGAGNATSAAAPKYPPGPVRINPRPLSPLPLFEGHRAAAMAAGSGARSIPAGGRSDATGSSAGIDQSLRSPRAFCSACEV